MIEINLIPDVKQELVRAQIQRNVIISVSMLISIVAVSLVLLVASYVYVGQALAIRSSNDTIDKEFAQLSAVEDIDKMITIKNQLSAVSALDQDKHVTSRLYDMLNVVVPKSPNKVTIASIAVEPPDSLQEDQPIADEAEGELATASSTAARITIEGQTPGGFSSLEAFEKMLASAVIEYKLTDNQSAGGDLNCGNDSYQCVYLAEGGGDRATAIDVAEMNFGEDQSGKKALFFKLSFNTVPEFFSNKVKDVRIKIGKDGNVTDSYLGVPRAIFESRPERANDGQ